MHDRAEGPSRGFCCAEHRQRWRAAHEDEDLLLESRLDETLLGMRRASDKSELETLLGEALQLLGELQHAYRTFQSESVQIAREHPGLIRGELQALREKLLQFHALRPYDAYLAKLAHGTRMHGPLH